MTSKPFLYITGIALCAIGAVSSSVNLSAGLLFIIAGILVIPFTWGKINDFFSLQLLIKLRTPITLSLVLISTVMVGIGLKSNVVGLNPPGSELQPLAQADNERNQASGSRGVAIENLPEPAEMKIGSYHALIIGIDEYQGEWNPLQNAVNDAKAIEKTLRNKYAFNQIRTLYNREATRENIIKEFEWLVNNTREEDNVLIFYSGHGELWEKVNKGYWIPADAATKSTSGYLSNLDIKTYLSGIKTKHILLIADACFSGDLFRGKTEMIDFENSEKYYKTVYNKLSRQAISSGGVEPVMDGGAEGHSVFSYYLLKALNENDKKFMDAGELYNQIRIPVVNNSNQSPIFAPIKDTGDEGGQFLFINLNTQGGESPPNS